MPGGHAFALALQRDRVVHRELRHLLGDRLALGFVRIEHAFASPAVQPAASSQERFIASAMPAFMP
jgi:hypothetical protein